MDAELHATSMHADPTTVAAANLRFTPLSLSSAKRRAFRYSAGEHESPTTDQHRIRTRGQGCALRQGDGRGAPRNSEVSTQPGLPFYPTTRRTTL